MATLSPLRLSILGMDSINRCSQNEDSHASPDLTHNAIAVTTTSTTTSEQRVRAARKPTSYFNALQTTCAPSFDDPPSYANATRHSYQQHSIGHERLPAYSCSVNFEGKVQLSLESVNPLHGISESEWRDIYVVLRGTLLNFYRVKDNGPGKLLRSYSLQYAEVGLATDAQHHVLIPQSRLANLIPSAARRKAWQKDPDLFRLEKQTILRLRAETDQLLLADSSESRIFELIKSLSAAIDISPVIDERSIPKQCTVPRRRRRRAAQPSAEMQDPTFVAEQERIMRELYPGFAGTQPAEIQLSSSPVSTHSSASPVAREEDDIDMSMIREDFEETIVPVARPTFSRQTTASSMQSFSQSSSVEYASAPENFGLDGKWQPPHSRTEVQVQRYIRRCMPILSAESVRASDVLVSNGRRVKVNWRMQMLEDWELKPPSYRVHYFTPNDRMDRRSMSQSSASGESSGQITPGSERSLEQMEADMAQFVLTKTVSNTSDDKPIAQPQTASRRSKTSSTRNANEVPGVVFCF